MRPLTSLPTRARARPGAPLPDVGRACARSRSRGDRRGAGWRPAAAAPFTPASDPLNLLWWDPTTVSSAVSAWVDKIAGVSAAQATGTKHPQQSSTAIGGAFPGVTGDAGDSLVANIAAIVGGKTTLTLIAAMVDTEAGSTAKVAAELTTNSTSMNGGFFVVVNDGGAGRLNAAVRGTTNFTERYAAETLVTVKVVAIGYDFATAGADAVKFIRINGVAQALTNQMASSVAGIAAADSLYLFGRGPTPTLGWAGTFGDIVIRNSVAEDAGLEANEDFIAARCGQSF